MPSISNTLAYPVRTNATLWERIKMAWALVRHGQPFQAPRPWYEKVNEVVSSRYSALAEQAVDKAERDFAHTHETHDLRRREAIRWLQIYVSEAKLGAIQPHMASFLVEWWVMRRKAG